jgi:hypothetical protein
MKERRSPPRVKRFRAVTALILTVIRDFLRNSAPGGFLPVRGEERRGARGDPAVPHPDRNRRGGAVTAAGFQGDGDRDGGAEIGYGAAASAPPLQPPRRHHRHPRGGDPAPGIAALSGKSTGRSVAGDYPGAGGTLSGITTRYPALCQASMPPSRVKIFLKPRSSIILAALLLLTPDLQ